MRRALGALTAVGVLGIAGHATAENAKNKRPPSQNRSERLFAALDEDGDGLLSASEFYDAALRHVAEKCDERFQQLDKNADGRVSPNEVVGMDERRFHRLDLNADGTFTALELRVAMHQQAARRLRDVFARMDRDRDGRCTPEEMVAHRYARNDRSNESQRAVARSDVAQE